MAKTINTNAYMAHYSYIDNDYRDYVSFLTNINGSQNIYLFYPDYRQVHNLVLISSTEDEDYVKAVFSGFAADIEKITTKTILNNDNHLDLLDLIERLSKGGAVFNDIDLKKVNAELEKR